MFDERTKLLHDYTRRSGVVSAEVMLPGGGIVDRSLLWNGAEAAEKRKDSRTAREWVLGLPSELSPVARAQLAREFGSELIRRYGVAIDVAVHLPDRAGDERNHHAHILCTTRAVTVGEGGALLFGAKTSIELGDKDRVKAGIAGKSADDIAELREKWAELANTALAKTGSADRIDHRSFAVRGIELEPAKHLGPTASDMERKGRRSRRGDEHRARQARNTERKELRAQLAAVENEIREEIEVMKIAAIGGSLISSFSKPGRRVPTPAPLAVPVVDQAEEAEVLARRSREVWKRYQAAGNTWGAGVGQDDAAADVWFDRRIGWLQRRYGDADLGRRLSEQGVVIDWISFPQPGDHCAQLRMRIGGATVIDDGKELSTTVDDDQAIALMLEVAKAKGWETITLSGNDEFVRKSLQAIEGTGLTVTSINGKAVDKSGRLLPKQPKGPGR